MLQKDKKILSEFYNLKLPNELKNEDYDFVYDNTLLAGYVKSALSSNYDKNFNPNQFFTSEYINATKKTLIKYNNLQEIVKYFDCFNQTIKILEKLNKEL